jgi:hypothetical protein
VLDRNELILKIRMKVGTFSRVETSRFAVFALVEVSRSSFWGEDIKRRSSLSSE